MHVCGRRNQRIHISNEPCSLRRAHGTPKIGILLHNRPVSAILTKKYDVPYNYDHKPSCYCQGAIPRQACDCCGGEPAAEKPEKLPVATLDWVTSMAEIRFQFAGGEMRLQVDMSCHPHVLQQYAEPAYDSTLDLPFLQTEKGVYVLLRTPFSAPIAKVANTRKSSRLRNY